MGNCCTIPVGSGGPGKVKQKAKRDDVNVGPEELMGTYTTVRLLGRGMAGDTWLLKDKETSKLVAAKLFPRPIPDVQHEPTIREFQTQTDLGPGSVNLINVYEAILTPRHLGLIMEVADGGSLTQSVASQASSAPKGHLVMQEEEARYYFTQFVDAMAYCHQHGIAHRDLKLDNALLDKSEPAVLKLCDFGFARGFGSAGARLERVNSHLGTPEYMSPELLHNGIANSEGRSEDYDPRETDVWAAGVMLVVCLLGAFPFDHSQAAVPGTTEDETNLWKQEVNQSWQESPFIASNISALPPPCKELLNAIFQVEPKDRITVDGIRSNAWFSKPFSEPYSGALSRIRQQNQDLISHVQRRKLDMDKVRSRNVALREMIDRACTKEDGVSKSFASKPLKPLEQVSKSGQTDRIDLSENAVLESSQRLSTESRIVRERTDPHLNRSNHDDPGFTTTPSY